MKPWTKTIDWDGSHVLIIDQTLLPHQEEILRITEVDELCEAIRSLRVRGAMALGVAGALGVALAVTRAKERGEDFSQAALSAARTIRATRPTAVNLGWGVDQALSHLQEGAEAVVERARAMIDEDVRANEEISRRGAKLLGELIGNGSRQLSLLTHCNAGALAGVDWGTALGVVRAAHEDGLVREVLTPETRPLLQGARLTAWELGRMGVPYRVIVDGAGAGAIATGAVDAVVVGADRIARNGDVANKVGTYAHALAAHRAGIPFIVAAPEATIDPDTPSGSQIPIEERSSQEVLMVGGRSVAPDGAQAFNPAFDVTPADLVTAIVTERRIVRTDRGEQPGDRV